MFANISDESGVLNAGTDGLKRFFRWILGCTYAKKTIRTRIAEMFHFADAPHIIIYERNEDHPWWWTVAIITTVLVAVLSIYYTLEAGVRAVRNFMRSFFKEPQSTVSTPLCLSPVKESRKASPQSVKREEMARQKIPMNEPVNCVFIRPTSVLAQSESPKKMSPIAIFEVDESDKSPDQKQKEKDTKKKASPPPRLDQVHFDASSNVNIRPTLVASPNVACKNPQLQNNKRNASGAETSFSENEHIEDWVTRQISGCQKIHEEMEDKSEKVDVDFLGRIQDIIEAHLNDVSLGEIPSEIPPQSISNENISEMSMVTGTTNPSLAEIVKSMTEIGMSGTESCQVFENGGREMSGNEEEADIVIEDSDLFAENENECAGSVLVAGPQQKVLFRWTDEQSESVDSVTITGSFFGWNMHVPMRRSGEKTFESCLELPAGLHDYSIRIFRFDS